MIGAGETPKAQEKPFETFRLNADWRYDAPLYGKEGVVPDAARDLYAGTQLSHSHNIKDVNDYRMRWWVGFIWQRVGDENPIISTRLYGWIEKDDENLTGAAMEGVHPRRRQFDHGAFLFAVPYENFFNEGIGAGYYLAPLGTALDTGNGVFELGSQGCFVDGYILCDDIETLHMPVFLGLPRRWETE